MDPDAICRLCGSKRIIPKVRIIDHEEGYELDLNVEVCERPNAPLEKRGHYGRLCADVCADCGHAELFVPQARELWDVYQKSLAGSMP